MWSNLAEGVGPTWGDLQHALAEDATHLALLGQEITCYSYDHLLGFEYSQANNALFGGTLDTALDIYDDAPGLPLTFGRVFPATVTGRFEAGALGYGWRHEWDIRLVSGATATDVPIKYVVGPGGVRAFTWDEASDVFVATPGDTGTLSWSEGMLVLQERSGLAYRFDSTTNRLVSVRDANGNEIAFTYSEDKLVQLTHSNGDTLSISYNAAGLISEVQDSTGRIVTYAYDAANEHLVSVTRIDGVCRYEYVTDSTDSSLHALIRIETPDGSVRTLSYGYLGRIRRIEGSTPDQAMEFEYDSTGVMVATVPATDEHYRFYMNQMGQVCRVVDPLGRISQARYDDVGKLTSQLLPNNSRIDYFYDEEGHLVSTQDTMGQSLTFTYDPDDHWLTGVIDQKGNLTEYQYDDHGNMTGIVHADGSDQLFTYDAEGNLTSSANRRDQVITYTYDKDGLLTSKQYEDGSQDVFTYDAHGNLITATDASGTTTMTYDAADRMTKITYPGGRFLQYTYDGHGRRIRMEDQDGFVVNYAYDSAGRLRELRDAADAFIVTYVYDARGRLSREDKGNGTYTTYEYDAAGQLLHLINHAPDGSINSRFDYTYDILGQPIGMETLDGIWAYEYDPTGQLIHATFASTNPDISDQDLTYVYDPAGNRIRTIINGVATAYTTNNLNQYTTVGAAIYEYDTDGNLTGKVDGTDTWMYTFDSQNRLIEATTPEGTWTYEYNSLNQRTAETHDGVRTEYVNDPLSWGFTVTEHDTGDVSVTHYTWGLGLESSTVGGDTYFHSSDGFGNIVNMSNQRGVEANDYAYRPYGEIIASTENVANQYTFDGQFGVQTKQVRKSFLTF
jgi:YD repeat-containing protein